MVFVSLENVVEYAPAPSKQLHSNVTIVVTPCSTSKCPRRRNLLRRKFIRNRDAEVQSTQYVVFIAHAQLNRQWALPVSLGTIHELLRNFQTTFAKCSSGTKCCRNLELQVEAQLGDMQTTKPKIFRRMSSKDHSTMLAEQYDRCRQLSQLLTRMTATLVGTSHKCSALTAAEARLRSFLALDENQDRFPVVKEGVDDQMIDQNVECSICCQEINGDHELLVCGHGYHHDCLRLWLDLKACCPTCRAPLQSK